MEEHIMKISQISQKSFNSISTNLKPYTNYILSFLKSQHIKEFTLEDSYQITMNLFQHSNYDLLKLVSLFSFIQFNNLQFNQSNFNNYCQQLNPTNI